MKSKRIFSLLFILTYFISSPTDAGVFDPNIFVSLAKKVVPSVVNISIISSGQNGRVGGGPGGPGAPDDPFRRFFEDFFRQKGGRPGAPDSEEGDDAGPGSRGFKTTSLGSGFIIDATGLILTNNHVVAEAEKILISFTESKDEKPTEGQVVGRDPEIDIALIKVKTNRKLVPLAFGDSDALEVGEFVMAVGNPLGQGHTVTHGIISAKQRLTPDFPLANYLQTDAPINPGNSGGPLVNLKGEVIGVNNAIYREAQGISFAIPSGFISKVLPQLKTEGTVKRGYLGVVVHPVSPEIAGKIGAPEGSQAPFVTHVYPDSPAGKAGVKPYDLILSVNNQPITSPDTLIALVTSLKVGQVVTMKISRGGKEQSVEVKVAERPASNMLAGNRGGDRRHGQEKKEKKPIKPRVKVGMQIEDLSPEVAGELGVSGDLSGVLVTGVDYGGPADVSEIRRGDIIVEVDRAPIKSVGTFFNIVKEKKSYLLRIRRIDPSGRDVFIVVVLDLKA